MEVTASERLDFVRFMRQDYWTKQYQKDVTIYSLETDWLTPYHPVFYVGATAHPKKRENEHRRIWRKYIRKAIPDDFCVELASVESRMEFAFSDCTVMRKCIAATAYYQGYELGFTRLDGIFVQDYQQDEQALTPLEKTAVRIGAMNTPFSSACHEKERRWIFKKLQEYCLLTNVERMCTQMIGELQGRPELDVITTPFASPLWNPVIRGYLGYTNGWNRKSEEENSLSGLEKREKRLSCLGKSFKSVEKQSFHFCQSDRSDMRAKTASTNDGTDVC
jgi:hypothetical protein